MEGERLLVTLGEGPDAIDTGKAVNLPQYRALARLLEPYFHEERSGWFSPDKDDMHRWLRRLCG